MDLTFLTHLLVYVVLSDLSRLAFHLCCHDISKEHHPTLLLFYIMLFISFMQFGLNAITPSKK